MELLQFFAYAHLPPHLQAVSALFTQYALRIAAIASRCDFDDWITRRKAFCLLAESSQPLFAKLEELPANSERDRALKLLQRVSFGLEEAHDQYDVEAMLHLLLQSKDCAVRAVLLKSGSWTIGEDGAARQLVT